MNTPNDILKFIKRWQDKTSNYSDDCLSDVFDHFFSAFVLYNFLYNQITDREKYSYKSDQDKATKTIKKYLGTNAIFDDQAIKENANKITKLISNDTFYIRDAVWDAQRIIKLKSTDKETWCKGLLEMIYNIRCNMFHGSKQFTEGQKQILIPCIKIISRINSKAIDTINA